MTQDCIMIDGLHIDTIIGCLDWERQVSQPVVVDLKIYVDLSKAGLSDDLNDTLDYAQICDITTQTIQQLQAQLVEHAGLTVIQRLFAWDNRIEKIALSIKKPTILPQTQAVGIYLERSRP
ncbi:MULTISPECIES: dihydroneopterin aldolase [unclassified Acinetobacter]|uniref:dihydroneopterin aldolase n=1 Tax=unclassified Acinetobacter TaxID=196816 RepID=UPI0035BB4C0B